MDFLFLRMVPIGVFPQLNISPRVRVFIPGIVLELQPSFIGSNNFSLWVLSASLTASGELGDVRGETVDSWEERLLK